MKLAIITHVTHGTDFGRHFAYGPYVREMNIWTQYIDQVLIVAPVDLKARSAIDLAYAHSNVRIFPVKAFNITSIAATVKTLILLPAIFISVYRAMKLADHIHLRCPGNMGLIGCLVQVLFPKKKKSAKYAGNWDPDSKQPLSYKLQKIILNNTFLTRNMQTLVYGEWPKTSANIKPFFTATYYESDKVDVPPRDLSDGVTFLFVGTLSEGKQPLYALQLVEKINQSGLNAAIEFYGEGNQRNILQDYINQNGIRFARLMGNQEESVIRRAYQQSHFLVLPSKSEGWPKVVAEAMFWQCVPMATSVSCVPYMLDQGKRGILLTLDLQEDSQTIVSIVSDVAHYKRLADDGISWSGRYTLDVFAAEVQKILSQ
ncbi:MAG TPA: glycosyltransferase [Flavobacterium sp.]|jgi:glycosyltransferase involved in cell wall biosynthesis